MLIEDLVDQGNSTLLAYSNVNIQNVPVSKFNF